MLKYIKTCKEVRKIANIALLNRCNLRCPYCFADNYIASEESDITVEAFKKLLDFSAPDGEVGIIGGEPLLHKDIDEILETVACDYRFNKITLFTNGIFIDKHLKSLMNNRIKLLINVNSPRDIGGSFERLEENIDMLFSAGMGHSVSLGVNVYEENQDFSFIIHLLKKHRIKRLRVSVVIPHDKSEGGINYFLRMKKTLLCLYRELKEIEVCPCYDCNAIPECIYTEKEKELLSSLPFANQFEREIFLGKRSVCSPVIDLYPDQTATRCFGCFDMDRVDIKEFENIIDLKNYFFMKIDSKLVHRYSWEKCKTCYRHKTFGCFGGCLAYKEIK